MAPFFFRKGCHKFNFPYMPPLSKGWQFFPHQSAHHYARNHRIDNMSHFSQRIIKPGIAELTTCSTSVSTSLRPESQN